MKNICEQEGMLRYCTGCGMCSAICPYSAIKIDLDSNGFYKPKVDENKCISCSLCKKVCYRYDIKLQQNAEIKPIECYSAINKNDYELSKASSGAVSIELMKICLQQGYYIVGVAYDYQCDRAISRIAKTEEELVQFRGSKYFQSYTEEAFKTVAQDKSEQKYAIFGTPCQIYSFSKLTDLKNNSDKYLLVDIFCHGCPSMKSWEKYISYQKNISGISEFENILFRSKTHSWHEFCFDFNTGEKQYSSSKINDPFYELFFGMDIMNEACYECIPRSSIEKTDIRLGDFWGWQFDADTDGVSAVVINTKKGKDLFDLSKDRFNIEVFSFEEVIEAQSYGKKHTYSYDRRQKLFDLLNSSYSIMEIQKKYRKMLPFRTNIRRLLKNVVKRTPKKLYMRIRKEMHMK